MSLRGCVTITMRRDTGCTNLWCEPRTDFSSNPSCSNRRMISRLSRSMTEPRHARRRFARLGRGHPRLSGNSVKKDVDGRVKPGHDKGGQSHPLHKTIHHPLLPRLVEGDGELVAVHGGDVAVAEFLVKHALA